MLPPEMSPRPISGAKSDNEDSKLLPSAVAACAGHVCRAADGGKDGRCIEEPEQPPVEAIDANDEDDEPKLGDVMVLFALADERKRGDRALLPTENGSMLKSIGVITSHSLKHSIE